MAYQHAQLAAGRWQALPLVEQLANVGSEVARAYRWQGKDLASCEKAFARALELLDLTIQDPRWKGRRKEMTRARELLCDAMLGGTLYRTDLASLDRYFFHFAVAARAGR
jgi:hypothetical protein